MSNKSVVCISKTRAQTEQIIESLHHSGFDHSEISVLMPETDSRHDIGHVKATKAPEGTATGAASGGVAGGVLGLLAGIGALAIPGVGPLIAAGPIMAALGGAAVGAATGGIVGGLIGLGIPEVEAKIYEGKLKTGNYLVSVNTNNGDEVDRAKQVFDDADAEDICTTSQTTTPGNEDDTREDPTIAAMSSRPAERAVSSTRL
jgi:hypothetical protein